MERMMPDLVKRQYVARLVLVKRQCTARLLPNWSRVPKALQERVPGLKEEP
jgi:hypothetical protein